MTAVIANRLEDLTDENRPRAYLVDKTGADFTLESMLDVCEAIQQSLTEAIGEYMRRFAIIGHRANPLGKLPLSDLASGAGRMDVLIGALMASLLTSHGFRKD